MRVAVMGCVVNGPGESKHADIGISLPGTFEEPVAPVFIDGKLDRTLRGDGLVDEFIGILEDYVDRRYPRRTPVARRLIASAPPRSRLVDRAWRRHGHARLSRSTLRVYSSHELNGRSVTWVTPTFLFVGPPESAAARRRS
jgi:hypothetical protein